MKRSLTIIQNSFQFPTVPTQAGQSHATNVLKHLMDQLEKRTLQTGPIKKMFAASH